MSLPQVPAHLLQLANIAAEEDDQMTQPAFAGHEVAAGTGFAVLTQYIELGLQPPKAGAKFPKNKHKVRLVFTILGANWPAREIEIDGVKQQVNDEISLVLTKSASELSDYNALMQTMQRHHPAGEAEGLKVRHMTGFLGVPFIVDLVQNKVGEAGKEKTYTNMNSGKNWNLRGTSIKDPVSGQVTNYQAPAMVNPNPYKVFLFDRPTKETWDALFIPGERQTQDGKKESKNWLQELIQKAVNYPGSQLQALLGGVLPTATDAAAALAAAQASVAAQALPAVTAPAQQPNPVAEIPVQQPAAATQAPVVAQPEPAPTVSQPAAEPAPAVPAAVEVKADVPDASAYELTEKSPDGVTMEQFLATPGWTLQAMIDQGYARLKPVATAPAVPVPGALPLPTGLALPTI